MKSMRIAALILAAAALNTSYAYDAADPTGRCMARLSLDERLDPIADKVALGYSGETAASMLERRANEAERAALAVWLTLRKQCFEAGEQYRDDAFSAQTRAVMQSTFLFQQVLLSRLQQGQVTYVEFNDRRAELALSLDPRK